MKRNMKSLLISVSVLSAIGFTSCDENATIDVPGPDVEFTFNYDDINAAAPAQRSSSVWLLKASDTIPAKNATEFLESDSTNKKYAEAIVAATLKDCELSVTGGTFNFAGVDSVKIDYKLLNGSTTIYDLIVGGPVAENLDVIHFNDIKITKDQALEMINTNKVARMWIKINLAIPTNCFAPGAVYNFKASSMLSVKASSALSGGLGF